MYNAMIDQLMAGRIIKRASQNREVRSGASCSMFAKIKQVRFVSAILLKPFNSHVEF
jgi:hypothetical protein